MPDPWEDRCDLDTDRDDTQEDLDNDGLTNGEEFRHGTLPCDPDTDDGGEQDGSEVRAGRNALEPSDDLCSPLGRVRMRALDQGIGINWPRPDDFSEMYLHLSTSAGELGQRYTIPATGEFELAQLANDQTYYVTLAGVNEDAICDYAETEEVIPKEDPDPPYGWILINSGAEATFSRDVLLNLSASDEAADGAVTMPGILTKGPVDVAPASVNDDLEMRISNDPSLEGAAWEPLSSEKPWNLGDTAGRIATVHAQFRDEAGNESTVVVDNIYLETGLYISPTATTIGISDTVTVDVIAGNVEALYGVEFHLSFDPDVVQVEDAIPGGDVNVIPGDFLDPGAVVHQNYVNNGTGEVEYVQTRQGAVEGVGGSGVLARIVFHGKAFGTSTLTFTLHTLSDPLSVPIEHTAGSGEVTVGVPTGAVRGKVVLERRVDYPNANAGATVELAGRSLLIGSDGNYNFTGVPEGTHQISATHPSYLPAWRTIEVVTGATTDVPTVTLLGGDCSVAPQGQISGEDSVAMALAWGSTPSDPHWSARADIRDDNSIDVLDFVAVKFNWRATAPGPWPAVAAASHVAQAPPAPGPAAPQSPAVASVVLTPTVITTSLGTPATVDIWVHDVTDLYGAGFLLQFDPEVVGVEDANPFEDGVQIESGSWLQRQLEAANSVDDAAGEVDFFVTQSYPEPAKSGSGLLARITLTGLANGSSVLHFESIQLVDDEETILAASSQDGEVVVTGEHRVFLPVVLRGAEG
jgi:hypothetical protein